MQCAIPWGTNPIVEEIRGSNIFFEKLKPSLARRSANCNADWVANRIMEEMCPPDWVIAPPCLLLSLLLAYCNGSGINIASTSEFG